MNAENVPFASRSDSPDEAKKQLLEIFTTFESEQEADVFVISGTLSRTLADEVSDAIESIENLHTNVAVFLCTNGGDADAAYIIAKAFKGHYERFSLYVCGLCKSAGTLLALGATEIVMSERGEFGPLDVQLQREDNIALYSSGLDLSHTLAALSEQAFDIFED